MAFIHRTSSGDLIIGFPDDEIREMEVRLTSDDKNVNSNLKK